MTRKEAIQILSTRDAHGVLCGYTSGVTEALDMAIEALQDKPKDDMISRINALEQMAQAECGLHYEDCEADNCSCSYIQRILDIPKVDVVEVVRCKDCCYYNPIDECKPYPCSHGLYMCNKDDYCSYGERRE